MKIVKVMSVVDTRQYEEEGDRFVPIPGSGNLNACSRCTRTHEIHWTVLLEGGDEAVVGGSCAKAGSLDRNTVMSAERFASRRRRLEKELSVYEDRLAELKRVIAEVDTLPRAPFIEGTKTLSDGTVIPTLQMGDGTDVWCQFTSPQDPERRRAAEYSWKAVRIAERTKIQDSLYQLESLVRMTKKNLEAVGKKLKDSVGKLEVTWRA